MVRDRMLRRIQVIVALMMILSVFVGSPASQAAPPPKADLDQLANGKLGTPVTCEWVNGNVNESKAQYFEGDSVPYRFVMSNLDTGISHTITIEWDTTKSGAHALDYLTTFNRTVACADPLVGTDVAAGTIPSTYPIPIDPDLAGFGVTPVPGVFSLYNGTITGVSAYGFSGSYASDSSRSITITFTVTSPDAVLAVGGHIGSRLDWGIGGSASAISGSPYHMALLDLDGKGGKQDRSLSASAVYYFGLEVAKSGPSLSKIGDVVTYTFAITNASDSDSPALNKQSITDNVLGTVGLGQCGTLSSGQSCTFDVGYTVPGTASDPLVNTVTAVFTPTASTQIVSGTASHSLNLFQPSIVVEKSGPATAHVGETITYTVRITNTSSADSPALTLASLSDSLKGDVSSMASSCSPLGYDASCSFTYSYQVPQGSSDPLVNTVSALYHPLGFPNDITGSDSHSVDLLSGDLDVVKVVNWNGVTPDAGQTFTFTITGPSYPSGNSKSVGSSGGTASWTGLIPGTYTVVETNPGNAWTVTPGLSQQVTVPGDGTATATFTNTRKLGGLDVVKVVDWNDVPVDTGQTFTFTITGPSYPGGDSKSVGHNGGTASWSGLVPGDYTVTETSPGSQWVTLPGLTQDVTVPADGGTASVTFTNTRLLGGLTVVKVVEWNGVPEDTGQTFEVCIAPAQGVLAQQQVPNPFCHLFDYDGGFHTFQNLAPGDYVVTETNPGSAWTVVGSGVTVTVPEDGSAVSTTITNTRKLGGLEVTKVVNWNGVTPDEGQSFTITITGPSYPGGNSKSVDYNGGIASWSGLIPGDYTVVETNPGPAWTVIGSGVSVAVPASGGTASATITNTRVPAPALELIKVANPTSASPEDVVAYTLYYTNSGDITLTGVTITDDPDETYVAGISAISNGGTYDGDEITWAIGTLAAGASGSVTYRATLKDEDAFAVGQTAVDNVAVIDSNETGPAQDDATVTVSRFLEPQPALTLAKEVGTSSAGPWQEAITVQVGSDVYYRLTVTNSGDVALTALAIVDPDVDASGCTWPAELAPGASAECVVGPVSAEAGKHVNTAQATAVFAQEVDVLSNEDSAAYTGVQPGLAIDKSVAPASAEPGDTVVYTIAYSNTGTMNLTGVTITDSPDWTHVASIKVGESTYTSGDIVWAIGNLAAGASGSVTYQATLKGEDAFAVGSTAVTNTAIIGANEVDPVSDDATVIVGRKYEQLLTPVPCIRADVAVVIYGGWNGIPVKAWVGGTEQTMLYTAVDAFGQQQVMWTLYPPENTTWSVTVQPQTPEGKDGARWQYKLLRIESPSQGTVNNNPGAATVSIRRCNQYVLYFQLMDNGTTPDVAPTPPSEPQLPVTGGGPGPILAGGMGLFAALSGLGWTVRRRRSR